MAPGLALLIVNLAIFNLERDGLAVEGTSEHESAGSWATDSSLGLCCDLFCHQLVRHRNDRDRGEQEEPYEKVLIASICSLDVLLKGTHKPVARPDILLDLRVVDLEEETVLARHGILDFGDLVPRAANLDKLLLGRCCPCSRLLGEKLSLVQ
jgi:hypothetical protein